MCGICGIYSLQGISKETAEKFQRIMVNCESRGKDAFGFTTYPSNAIFKTKGNVSDFIKTSGDFYNNFNGQKIVLAHTRAVTKGSPDKNQNNHPFETEDFILAHNGMIYNDDSFKITSDIETDSYVIVKNIQDVYDKTNNVVTAIKETTKLLRGSYACWLLVKKTGSVYLFRHSNPIEIRYDPKTMSIVFASEKDMLYPMVAESDIKGFYGGLSFAELEEHKIYRLTNTGLDELDSFEANDSYYGSYNCYNIGSYKQKTSERFKSEQEFVEELFTCYDMDWFSLVNTLDYYGIHAYFKDGHVWLHFRSTDIYDNIQRDMSAMGYTISPKTKTLRIPSITDLIDILDAMQDLDETVGEFAYC